MRMDQLPDDVETLKRLLIEQATALYSERLLVEKLKLQIARLRRMQFGSSSERHSERIAQLELIVEELEAHLPPQDESIPPAPGAVSGKDKPVRKPLPDHLPRTTEEHAPACGCPHCGTALKRLGEDVSEYLELIPEHFKVVRVVRPKMNCPKCSAVVQAPAPSRPIPKSIAGAGLLAHVAVSKYLDHLPLYRQSEIYARQGVDLERSTMAGWIGAISDLVRPLVEEIGRYVVAGNKVHADDTPVPVLDPGRGTTKTARLWAYVRDDRPAGSTDPPAAWYRYTPTREGAHPRAHLAQFEGTLQADGFSGFNGLYESGRIRGAGCWAHARRKFYDLWDANRSPVAKEALDRIQALYAIEGAVRGKLPAERLAVRQRDAVPLLASLESWMRATLATVSAKSELAAAFNYSLKRWVALTRYSQDGSIEIDNNAAERAMKGPVLGRKNWLFAGSHNGGERAAAMYSLLETAKLNAIDPEAYLRRVLQRIPDLPINRIGELLPWNMATAVPQHEMPLAA
jgi:transposase